MKRNQNVESSDICCSLADRKKSCVRKGYKNATVSGAEPAAASAGTALIVTVMF